VTKEDKSMERSAIDQLKKWKENPRRKPLIVEGARQVGKTWLIKEFAKQCYQQLAYINFEEKKHLRNLFAEDFDLNRILLAVQTETKVNGRDADTLLFFDEIQEAENGLTVLKYFQENAPELHLIVAGSLLGIELHKKESFPVGKVDFLKMYPLSFREFLLATGETGLHHLLLTDDWQTKNTFATKYTGRLRQYYYVGGMPEAVSAFSQGASLEEVRTIQKNILDSYDNDFSKHAPTEMVPRIKQLWNSIPAQLSRENRKFVYGLVKEGARAREYELALMWLNDCGLIHIVNRVTIPKLPLKAYEDRNAFKLFMVDVGLMGAMNEVDAQLLLRENALLTEFKGAMTEQYVLQQIVPRFTPYYWSKNNAQAEIDFLIQRENGLVPIEVKAEENLRAKSLRLFVQDYAPALAIRTSMSPYRKESWMTHLPLWAI
jgi:predicted AAA+ superfamily ATPase